LNVAFLSYLQNIAVVAVAPKSIVKDEKHRIDLEMLVEIFPLQSVL
jgi:hypothetical protein